MNNRVNFLDYCKDIVNHRVNWHDTRFQPTCIHRVKQGNLGHWGIQDRAFTSAVVKLSRHTCYC